MGFWQIQSSEKAKKTFMQLSTKFLILSETYNGVSLLESLIWSQIFRGFIVSNLQVLFRLWEFQYLQKFPILWALERCVRKYPTNSVTFLYLDVTCTILWWKCNFQGSYVEKKCAETLLCLWFLSRPKLWFYSVFRKLHFGTSDYFKSTTTLQKNDFAFISNGFRIQ